MKEFFKQELLFAAYCFNVCCLFVLFVCRNYSSDEECAIVDSDDDTRSTKWNTSVAANAKRPCLDVSARNTQMLSARNTQTLSNTVGLVIEWV